MTGLIVGLALATSTVAVDRVWTVPEMQELAVQKAQAHGLKVQKFLSVVACESRWDRFAKGDSGRSHGLVQLFKPEEHWGLTVEQAQNPEIALEVMALAWKYDMASKWSCWKPG